MDLARRDIDVALAEMRAAGEPPGVRCNHVSSHTMEISSVMVLPGNRCDCGFSFAFIGLHATDVSSSDARS